MTQRQIHERMYPHQCNIYHYSKKRAEDGSMYTEESLLFENVRCRVSKSKQQQLDVGTVSNTAGSQYTLFISDLFEIPAGAIVKVQGKVYRAGEPFKYANSHQEIPIAIERTV